LPVRAGDANGAFASKALCNPLVLAIDKAASAIAVAFPVDVTIPVKLALVVTVAALPVILPVIGLVTVRFASVPTDVKLDAVTPAAKVEPVKVPAGAITALPEAAVINPFPFTVKVGIDVDEPNEPTLAFTVAKVVAFVLFPVPSKELPALVTSPVKVPIVLAVCKAVAVPALPVIVVWSPVLVPDRLLADAAPVTVNAPLIPTSPALVIAILTAPNVLLTNLTVPEPDW
jgi:hypothetical protein